MSSQELYTSADDLYDSWLRDNFVVKYVGDFVAPSPGSAFDPTAEASYNFSLIANDGARLYIDGELVVSYEDYDESSPLPAMFGSVDLVPGSSHSFELIYYENWAAFSLAVKLSVAGEEFVAVAPAMFAGEVLEGLYYFRFGYYLDTFPDISDVAPSTCTSTLSACCYEPPPSLLLYQTHAFSCVGTVLTPPFPALVRLLVWCVFWWCCAGDLDLIDARLPEVADVAPFLLLQCAVSLVLIAAVFPWFLLALLPVGYLFFFIARCVNRAVSCCVSVVI